MIIRMPKAPPPPRKAKRGEMLVQTRQPDGTWEQHFVQLGEDFLKQQAEMRKELRQLEDAGTPYWCIHKGREVDHPAAYWKENGYEREDGIEMQYKHGVMCRDCGGYIQEG